jgi:hypothetical protein
VQGRHNSMGGGAVLWEDGWVQGTIVWEVVQCCGCKVGTIVWEVVQWEDGWVQGRHNSMGGGALLQEDGWVGRK